MDTMSIEKLSAKHIIVDFCTYFYLKNKQIKDLIYKTLDENVAAITIQRNYRSYMRIKKMIYRTFEINDAQYTINQTVKRYVRQFITKKRNKAITKRSVVQVKTDRPDRPDMPVRLGTCSRQSATPSPNTECKV